LNKIFLVIVTFLAIFSVVKTQQNNEGIQFVSMTSEGRSCPEGSIRLNLDPNGNNMTLRLNGFLASIGMEFSVDTISDCIISIGIIISPSQIEQTTSFSSFF